MRTRALERLPTIRAKLGSTIVIAVAVTILLLYAFIGFALKNSPRDSEAIDALAVARKAAVGTLDPIPEHAMIVRIAPDGSQTIQGERLSVQPPTFKDGTPHWGVLGAYTYAAQM